MRPPQPGRDGGGGSRAFLWQFDVLINDNDLVDTGPDGCVAQSAISGPIFPLRGGWCEDQI